MRVGFAGNQPAGAEAIVGGAWSRRRARRHLGRLGHRQARPGVLRPHASELGLPPAEIAYVGDRVDNDILPAAAAGLFTVHLRRGPWGIIQAAWPEAAAADATAANLTEAVDAILARGQTP